MKKKFLLPLILMIVILIPLTGFSALSGEQEKKIPNFSSAPRNQIPIEYTWKTDDIYPDQNAWEADVELLKKMTPGIAPAAGKWISSASAMADFLELITEIYKKGERLSAYASLQSDMDLGNPRFQEMKGRIGNIFVEIHSAASFLPSDILKLGEQAFAGYLKTEPRLIPYRFYIGKILRKSSHVLPADQQNIVSMTGLFSGHISQAANILNDVNIPAPTITLSTGEAVSLNFANFSQIRTSKERNDRILSTEKFWENHASFDNTFAVLFDGAMKTHLFNAKIYNFRDCLDAALYENNIDPAVLHNLVKYVNEYLPLFHRYLKLKQRMLGLEKLTYPDIYASSVKNVDKKYTFDEAKAIVLKAMNPLGAEYARMLQTAFDNRWIDIYANKGKQSGAYSSGVYGVHSFIKLNYDGSYDQVSMLAHELGHAMHTYFANKTQHYMDADYSAFLAEIASTFNEHMLLHSLLNEEKDNLLKLYILDSFFNQIKGSVYRQTQFTEFELEMHRKVEAGESLTPEWLNARYLELARRYYGHDKGVTEVGEYIAHEWANVPHFFYNFYVYTYSTGFIASTALSELVISGGEKARENYLNLLKTGGGRFPLEALKEAGVDMTTPAPYIAAFNRIEALLSEMEKTMEKTEKKK